MKKNKFLYIIFLIILFFINPFISLLYNIYIYIVKECNKLKVLLILNLSILNYFKVPNYGDYVSYIDFFYRFNDILNLKNFLKYEKDMIFYFSMYLLNYLKFEYSEWAFITSLVCYYFVLETISLLPNEGGNKFKYVYFFIYNPYYITRSALASSIFIYTIIYYKKNGFRIKIILYSIMSILTHISTIFIPIYIYLQKILKNNKKMILGTRYSIIIAVFALLCGNFFKEILAKIFIIFNISLNYSSGDFVFEKMNYIYKIKSLLTSYFIFFIPILLSYRTKKYNQSEKKIYLSIIVMFFLLGFSPILARRLGIFIIGILICTIPGKIIKKKIRICIYSLFLISLLISYREHLYAGYYSQSYPFKFQRITKKLLNTKYKIEINENNRKIELKNKL